MLRLLGALTHTLFFTYQSPPTLLQLTYVRGKKNAI